jgi:hypothetical protein
MSRLAGDLPKKVARDQPMSASLHDHDSVEPAENAGECRVRSSAERRAVENEGQIADGEPMSSAQGKSPTFVGLDHAEAWYRISW